MKLKITLKEWESTCGNGCCYDYGKIVTVNGKEITRYGNNESILLPMLLNYLGYDVELLTLNENDETIAIEEYEAEREENDD